MQTQEIVLHAFAPQDRSGRVRWTLEELSLPYTSRFINWEKKEHESDAFLKINPMGRMPTMEWNGRAFHESTALCLMLADSKAGIAPSISSPLRADYYQWSIFPAASIEPLYSPIWSAEETAKSKAQEEFLEKAKPVIRTLERALEGKDHLVGNEFSTADILLATCLPWAGGLLLQQSSRLKEYFERIKERPACKKSEVFAE